MTDEQRKRFYFPIWTATAVALDWCMVKGRLLARLEEQVVASHKWPDHAGTAIREIIDDSQGLARALVREVTAEDLRHACNRLAAVGKLSSSKFSQGDLNQFDRLCAVLRAPWDMNARMAWLNPQEDNRLRLCHYLRKIADEAVLISICRNAWDTTDWESQPQARLDWLVVQVKERKKYGSNAKAQGRGKPWMAAGPF